MDTLKYCLIVIVFSCFCSQMSNASTSTAASTSTTATSATPTTQVVYGDNCDNPTQCLTTNAICNGSNTCACDDTHYYDAVSDTCTQKQAFGGACTDTSQCNTTPDTNIECIQTVTDKKCLCTNGWYRPGTSCIQTSPLKPTIAGTPTIGTGNIDITWTNTDATGEYTSNYTVTWSPGTPGSPASVPASQKSYNIQSLSPGTRYTVTVTHTITRGGRSQTIDSDSREFTTSRQIFGGVCTGIDQCDTSVTNIECVQTTVTEKKCLCKNGTYESSASSCTETSPLKPTITGTPTTGTFNIYISWTNTDANGGYTSSYAVTWSPGTPGSPPASVPANQKNFNIQSLSPGTTYTVIVMHTITQYGRSQTITSDQRTFSTKQVFGGDCSNQLLCDSTTDPSIECTPTTGPNTKCLCKDTMYKPSSSVPCTNIGPLKPVITDPPSTGTTNTYISWTNTDATGGYTSTYTVTWSPGTPASPPSVPANQKNYDIRSLSPGTTYTVTVRHTITQYGRSQTITSDPKTFTTRIGYNETCTQGLCYHANASCYSGRCRCDPRFHRSTTCVSINHLKPVTVAADVQDTNTITATWLAPPNAVVTGYLVTVLPGDITPISVDKDTRTTPITGLTPGRLYTVNVKTRVTYLQGRDEMTDALSAAPHRTTPASVVGLDMTKTNRTAPNITVVFAKATKDADSYLVTLSGRDGDPYIQQHQPANTGQGLISVVFTGVVLAVSYNLNIVTQSGNMQSVPYTSVIRVQSNPAGRVANLKSFGNTPRTVAVEWRRPVNPEGYIYEYVVDVKTGSPSVCVKQIIINCTECNRDQLIASDMEIECGTTMTVDIAQTDIENATHVIQHNITGLNPDTFYTVDVVAVNEDGPGEIDQISLHTFEEGAGDPTNFKAVSRSSSEITLSWDPPQPRPGVTQYNITVLEEREDSTGYDIVKIITVSGWETKTRIIRSLSSYWFYKFDIVAQTKEGASAIVRNGPERTHESEPTDVLEFKVEDIAGVFNQVQVSWKCPKQKDGRNGEIVNASLDYFTNQQSTYVEPVRMNKNFTNKGDCMWNVKVNVTTEFKYVFHVRLYNKGFAGSVVSVSKDIAGGVF